MRNAEAVTQLCRTDSVLLPAAWCNARAALEISGRHQWLLEPDDPWIGEARWIALQREGLRYYRAASAGDGKYRKTAEQHESFIDGVEAMLPSGTQPVKRIPQVADMLVPYGAGLAGAYRQGSMFVHGTEIASQTYRKNAGINAIYGEYVEEWEWCPLLNIVWQAYRACVITFMQRLGRTIGINVATLDLAVREAIDAVFTGAGLQSRAG